MGTFVPVYAMYEKPAYALIARTSIASHTISFELLSRPNGALCLVLLGLFGLIWVAGEGS